MTDDLQRQVTLGVRDALRGQKSKASWPQVVGAIISILTISAALATLVFVTRESFAKHEDLPGHPIANIEIKNTKEGLKKVEVGLKMTQEEVRKISTNVILIGEKLRVQGMTRRAE